MQTKPHIVLEKDFPKLVSRIQGDAKIPAFKKRQKINLIDGPVMFPKPKIEVPGFCSTVRAVFVQEAVGKVSVFYPCYALEFDDGSMPLVVINMKNASGKYTLEHPDAIISKNRHEPSSLPEGLNRPGILTETSTAESRRRCIEKWRTYCDARRGALRGNDPTKKTDNRPLGDKIVSLFPDAEVVRDTTGQYRLISVHKDGLLHTFKVAQGGKLQHSAELDTVTVAAPWDLLGIEAEDYFILQRGEQPAAREPAAETVADKGKKTTLSLRERLRRLNPFRRAAL